MVAVSSDVLMSHHDLLAIHVPHQISHDHIEPQGLRLARATAHRPPRT
jgi:hypothetical protein